MGPIEAGVGLTVPPASIYVSGLGGYCGSDQPVNVVRPITWNSQV